MTRHRRSTRNSQGGAFLLEALVGLLIFSFGILGIVALQAQSIRFTSDSEVRAEATYLANSLISTMWTDYNPNARAAFKSKYESGGGSGYTDFKNAVTLGMPGVIFPSDPVVTIDDPALVIPQQSKTSSVVYVQIVWQMPGDTAQHNYATTGIVGLN